MRTRYITVIAVLLAVSPSNAFCKNRILKKAVNPNLTGIRLPAGLHISIFADSVEGARSLAIGNKGTVFVGNRSGDKFFGL